MCDDWKLIFCCLKHTFDRFVLVNLHQVIYLLLVRSCLRYQSIKYLIKITGLSELLLVYLPSVYQVLSRIKALVRWEWLFVGFLGERLVNELLMGHPRLNKLLLRWGWTNFLSIFGNWICRNLAWIIRNGHTRRLFFSVKPLVGSYSRRFGLPQIHEATIYANIALPCFSSYTIACRWEMPSLA
jgi:hypothetical protein